MRYQSFNSGDFCCLHVSRHNIPRDKADLTKNFDLLSKWSKMVQKQEDQERGSHVTACAKSRRGKSANYGVVSGAETNSKKSYGLFVSFVTESVFNN